MSGGDLVVTQWGARFHGRFLPCAVGRGGIGLKQREGDGITPAGRFSLTQIWYRPDRINLAYATKIGLRDAWCDDPTDPNYNHPVRRSGPGEEKLRRADPLYDVIGVVDYNLSPVIAGKGSAIFLHVWRKPRHPTAGCIAFSKPDLMWILRHWKRSSKIVTLGTNAGQERGAV